MYFRHDVFIVVITQRAAKFIVVHVGFTFALAPSSGYLVRVDEFEFAVGAFPRDTRSVATVGEEFEKELP